MIHPPGGACKGDQGNTHPRHDLSHSRATPTAHCAHISCEQTFLRGGSTLCLLRRWITITLWTHQHSLEQSLLAPESMILNVNVSMSYKFLELSWNFVRMKDCEHLQNQAWHEQQKQLLSRLSIIALIRTIVCVQTVFVSMCVCVCVQTVWTVQTVKTTGSCLLDCLVVASMEQEYCYCM